LHDISWIGIYQYTQPQQLILILINEIGAAEHIEPITNLLLTHGPSLTFALVLMVMDG